MKVDRLERKIERLKSENERLRAEKKKLQDEVNMFKEKEQLIEDTQAEYNAMLSSLKETTEQYKLLIGKLRQYDSKIMRKYNKGTNTLLRASKTI